MANKDETLYDRVNRVTRIMECIPNIIMDLENLYNICYLELEAVKAELCVAVEEIGD